MKKTFFWALLFFLSVTARLWAADTYGNDYSPAAVSDEKEKDEGCRVAWQIGTGQLTYSKLTPEQRMSLNLLKRNWPQEYTRCYGAGPSESYGNKRAAYRAPSYEATVIQVLDADSVMLSTGERAELLGIKVPEGKDGVEAAEFLKSLVQNKKVRIQYDTQRQDKFGRLLVYLFREEDDAFVNGAMIEAGLAEPNIVAPNTMYQHRLLGDGTDPMEEEDVYLAQVRQQQMHTLASVWGVFIFSFILIAGFRIWEMKRRSR